MKSLLFQFILIVAFQSYSSAQVINPIKWDFTSKKINENTVELKFAAKIDHGWHMYGMNIPPNGPVATSFIFDNESNIDFIDKIHSTKKPEVKYDSTFEMNVELYDREVVFVRKIKYKPGEKIEIKGSVTYMACDDSRCLPPKDENFHFQVEGTIEDKQKQEIIETKVTKEPNIENESNKRAEKDTTIIFQGTEENNSQIQSNQSIQNKKLSLWKIILKALLGGLLALLTPCVYPIIPLTVSFFMRETSRRKSFMDALFFGGSIVFIYTMIGFITGLTRIDLAYWIKTQQLPNIVFFLLFVALAASFFGAFELVLPSKLTNKIDQKADKGGFLGPFFMALATVFVSFSCVGPIAGIILGDALRGEILTPVIGMFAFSLTFALPFTLLAIFPQFMKKLPKSGGWLNSVKVFFAFIMLAFSMVFITNLQLSFITRDVVLAIEIVLFILLGMYFLGKIKFSHDSDLPYVSVPRTLLAIASFSFAVYMIPGMFGAPLKSISPFLPPKEGMQFDLTKNAITASISYNSQSACSDSAKYADFLHMPLGLKGYFDYNEALACAKDLNKPVLLDFAGHSCKNCKKMYSEVWSDPRVLKLLNENFVIAVLYTDDNTKLAEEDMVVSKIDNQVKNTIGKKFNDLQIDKFKTNTLPLYAILNHNEQVITDKQYYEYSPDIDSFIAFLQNGISNFKK